MKPLRRRYGATTPTKGPTGPLRVRSVLAGAYKGKNTSERALLTHAVYDDAEKTLCGRILEERLIDVTMAEAAGTPPTCPTCLERFSRLTERALKRGGLLPFVVGPPDDDNPWRP